MGGVEPPFLYDHPSRYSFNGPTEKGFNPKAATIASWKPPVPKPKKDGPLIEFNKHPDSYLIVPYGNTNAQPMSPNTKKKVKWSRSIALLLRICELLGAVGMLICVISIKGAPGTVGWILRAAPAIGLLLTVYGTYHLARKATGRTPASSASYHVFAAMMDTGLIPFYVFSAMMANIEYSSGDKIWGTLFTDPAATPKIVLATYLISATNGGMHAVSLVLSLYLAILFRKISKLPPDMNPLEDNLTARPHKRNKSSISVPPGSSEKHLSQTTTASSNRLSNQSADPLISQTRRVPFMHTRTESTDSLPTRIYPNSDSKRSSRVDLPSSQLYQNVNTSARSSRIELPQAPFYQQSNHSARSSRTDLRAPPKPTSRGSATPPVHPMPFTDKPLPTRPEPQTQTTHSSLLKDNWFTHTSPSPSPPHTPSNVHYNNENSPPSPISDSPGYNHDDHSISEYSRTNTGISSIKDFNLTSLRVTNRDYAPLQTNSPNPAHSNAMVNGNLYDFDRDLVTPAPPQFFDADAEMVKASRGSPRPQTGDSDSTLKVTPKNRGHARNQSQAPASSAKQFWQQQDINSRPHPLELNPPTPPPSRPGLANGDVNGARPGHARASSFVGSGGKGRFYGDLNKTMGRESLGASSLGADDGTGRVISNSGADLGNGYGHTYGGGGNGSSAYSKVGGFGGMGYGMGVGRRRDVSGKVAEEGRGIRGAWIEY